MNRSVNERLGGSVSPHKLAGLACAVSLNSKSEIECPAASASSGSATGAKKGISTELLEVFIRPLNEERLRLNSGRSTRIAVWWSQRDSNPCLSLERAPS